ncbi:MAG: DNA topoisomerase IV subunit B [Planctomycetota bacterium]|nr:DNA topoisomerase IV subunit B [Planctomycetota bacterium]
MATTTVERNKYTAKEITVLKGLQPVRRRPAMYIGGLDASGLHHLVWEILDNSVDEVINGHATTVEVVLDKDAEGIRISDNGRGIPVDKHPTSKKPALETILTTLHAGGKFDSRNYKHAGGLHGVGSSVVNALSKQLIARVRRDGFEYEQRFRRGKPTAPMKKIGKARGSGTSVYFKPDDSVFPKVRFDPQRIREVLEARAYLHRGMTVVFSDKTTGRKDSFKFTDGIKEYLHKLVTDRGKRPTQDFMFYLELEDEPRIEVALQWTDETAEFIISYVNGVRTGSGGTHELGLKAGVVRAVRNYVEAHNLQPRGVTLTAEDIREGLSAVLSVYVLEPQFQGQTKDRLNNPEVHTHVANAVGASLELYFNSNQSVASGIVARSVLAARARAASRAAAQEVIRKSAVSHRLNLPGKLADCASTRPEESELFIVEGDSAGGSAKQARDRKYQAILPLRGKVLNTEQAGAAKTRANKEISDIVSALGCGLGTNFDIGKLRYHKVIILTDADCDGHHIATLLLTFFYRYLAELIHRGHIYLGKPPLYRIDRGGGDGTAWAWSDAEKERVVEELGSKFKNDAITRFKGLGEMSPVQLRETTMDPASRSLERVLIEDELETDRVVNELMGKDPAARYRLVMEEGSDAGDLDV